MNRLTTEDRARILGMMVEGMAIRAISRLTGASKNTIVKLLRDVGAACAEYQDKTLRGLTCRRLQLDEVWSFVYAKQKNVPEHKWGQAGDVWTWTAIDADTKLIASWMLGDRSADTARAFVKDLADRLTHRIQLTTDGLPHYRVAVDRAFGGEIDFAMLDKVYAATTVAPGRYSPPECVGTKKRVVRLTNAFSKKIENHFFALAIYFMHYNFARQHQTLRVSPAMAAGVSNKLWNAVDIIRMADEMQAVRTRASVATPV